MDRMNEQYRRSTRQIISCVLFALIINQSTFALDVEENAVFIRVIDVGAGLACVVRMPGDHYMVYDAGHWSGGGRVAFEGIQAVIPDNEVIDLLILSHSDSDHLGAVKQILERYTVKKILRGGLERQTTTWKDASKAIKEARQTKGSLVINLKRSEFPPGATYRFGETFVTMVAGAYAPPDNWDIEGSEEGSEFRNAGSIVMRLQFRGKAVLFTGDAVGRHIGDPDKALIATEKLMTENADAIQIDSDVLIAPHHGADNASSTAFIKAVSPEWVIFSAGHAHKHPRYDAASRYLNNAVAIDKMFRTDLGDDEGDKEWNHGRISGHRDKAGDDDVDILIRPSGEIVVEYRVNQ